MSLGGTSALMTRGGEVATLPIVWVFLCHDDAM